MLTLKAGSTSWKTAECLQKHVVGSGKPLKWHSFTVHLPFSLSLALCLRSIYLWLSLQVYVIRAIGSTDIAQCGISASGLYAVNTTIPLQHSF